MDGYFFDNIIHIMDNPEEGSDLLTKHDVKK